MLDFTVIVNGTPTALELVEDVVHRHSNVGLRSRDISSAAVKLVANASFNIPGFIRELAQRARENNLRVDGSFGTDQVLQLDVRPCPQFSL